MMATYFKKYLGKYLVTEVLDPEETRLPSPEALRRRIIIKNKRYKLFISHVIFHHSQGFDTG